MSNLNYSPVVVLIVDAVTMYVSTYFKQSCHSVVPIPTCSLTTV